MKRSKRSIRREKKENEEIQRSIPLDITFGKLKLATQDDESHHVPHDLILEILSRLPAKSILRFRAVSKLWYSITTTPDFFNLFASRSSTRPPSLLLTFQSNRKGLAFSFNSKEKCQVIFSFPQNNQNDHHSRGPHDSHQLINTSEYWKDLSPGRSQSVHGLVLLPGFVIWNPTIRQFFTLPKPIVPRYTEGATYLCYDPMEDKHKVVHLSKQPQVLTLGAQESWRVIAQGIHPTDHHHSTFSVGASTFSAGARGRYFNGILYYDTYDFLMSFDVRSETFNPPIKYPRDYLDCVFEKLNIGADCPLVIPYEGRLALVTPEIWHGNDKVDIFILEDADGHEWTRKCFLLPSNVDKACRKIFQGVTEAGELIFTSCPPPSFSSFYVIYFNPRSNSTRVSSFEGVHGICGHSFPNHIESLVSM